MTRAGQFVIFFLVVLAAFVLVPRVDAQVRYGSIVVEVTDQTGGAIPGADATITQTQTGLTRNALTNPHQ